MKTVKELVEAVAADKNAISAAQTAFGGIGAFIDDILVKLETGDIEGAKAQVHELQNLNTALIEAVPASVTPESAGPVGKSAAQQAIEAAEASMRDHMGKLAEIIQTVAQAGEHIRASAQAIAEGKALMGS